MITTGCISVLKILHGVIVFGHRQCLGLLLYVVDAINAFETFSSLVTTQDICCSGLSSRGGTDILAQHANGPFSDQEDWWHTEFDVKMVFGSTGFTAKYNKIN